MKTLASLKYGDLFTFPNKKTVYVRGEYSRTLKRYEYSKYDDINSTFFKKGSTIVSTNLPYN